MKNQLVPFFQFSDLIRYPIMIIIRFDRKFQIGIIVKRCKSKWPQLLFPPGFIYGYFGGLTRDETISFWFFHYYPSYIVCDGLLFHNFDNMFFLHFCMVYFSYFFED